MSLNLSSENSNFVKLLIELRRRLFYCFTALIVIFSLLFYFANTLYSWLAKPLLAHLPQGHGLIATNVVSPFFAPVELTLVAALFLVMPIILYQVWAFIAPALYRREKRLIWPILLLSILLFYTGVAFAYFVIFPLLFSFLTQTAPQGVIVSPDISQYLDFTLKLLFIFGVIFEVPVAILLLIWTGLTTRATLIRGRPYAVVGAFVVGMFLAPPDVLSQTLLAVPLYLLYEIGIGLAKFLIKV